VIGDPIKANNYYFRNLSNILGAIEKVGIGRIRAIIEKLLLINSEKEKLISIFDDLYINREPILHNGLKTGSYSYNPVAPFTTDECGVDRSETNRGRSISPGRCPSSSCSPATESSQAQSKSRSRSPPRLPSPSPLARQSLSSTSSEIPIPISTDPEIQEKSLIQKARAARGLDKSPVEIEEAINRHFRAFEELVENESLTDSNGKHDQYDSERNIYYRLFLEAEFKKNRFFINGLKRKIWRFSNETEFLAEGLQREWRFSIREYDGYFNIYLSYKTVRTPVNLEDDDLDTLTGHRNCDSSCFCQETRDKIHLEINTQIQKYI
jgi:hypothetical protein